jgi:hypothetical protein
MGEYVKDLYGNTLPHVKKYDIGATFANGGVMAESPGADEAGITPCSTTTAARVIGLAQDTATYVTGQQTDGTKAARYVSVVVNPNAIYGFLMSGGATEGTALTLFDVSTASTDGLTITTGDDWTSPQFDEGVVWGYDGANAGLYRKITTTSATAAAVTVAFDYDTVVGDNFLRAPYWPADATALTAQFTTNLYQANASIAVGTGCAVTIYEMVLRDVSEEGRTRSWVHLMSADNIWNYPT